MPNNFDRVAALYPLFERLSFGDDSPGSGALHSATRPAPSTSCSSAKATAGSCASVWPARPKRGNGSRPQRTNAASARRALADQLDRSSVKFIQADFVSWQSPSATFDLIYSHFFLDLFLPPSQLFVIKNIGHCAKPEALWVDVDYRCPHVGPWARWVDWLQYRFDRVFCGVEADRHHDPGALI